MDHYMPNLGVSQQKDTYQEVGNTIMKSILLSLLFVGLTLALFPTPKFAQISSTLKLSEGNSCVKFELNIMSEKVSSFMPHTLDTNLEASPGDYYFNKVMKRTLALSKCIDAQPSVHKVNVNFDESISKEGYQILSEPSVVTLTVSTYSGYVYALETLSQMIEGGNSVQLGKVQDEPIVAYRGIMIDPVRHFIGVNYIRKLIDAMPLSKLNIVHWLFSNDEAFVLNLIQHPELSQAGRYSDAESYSIDEVKELINFGKLNAVSIVPELDTPGHVRSWGLSQKWHEKNITILCPGGEHYNHQFDLSINDVYTLNKEVLSEVDSIFKESPYMHLGGDEVFGNCWDQRPAIKTFMASKGINNYGQLQMYWRFQLKQYLPASRKVIFWRNDADNVVTSPDDIVQYWGSQSQTDNVTKNSTSKLILSPSDFLYLNKGKTNIWINNTNGPFVSWRQIYQGFTVYPPGVDPARVLGAEACLWNEVQNQDTFENQIWMRASSFAARAWTNQKVSIAALATELISLEKKLKSMGIQPSPITPEWCEQNPTRCFPTTVEPSVSEKIDEVVLIE